MPIYEYKCEKCGEKFDARRGIDESDAELKCPKCGAEHPHRVISSFITGSSSSGGCAPSAPT